jgi:hypothetical protein
VGLCTGVTLQGLHRAPTSSNLTGALTAHCVGCGKEPKRHVMFDQVVFHIVGGKPSKAPSKGDEAAGFHIVGVKPCEALSCNKASDQITSRSPTISRHH